jgi:hypothetical protein
MSVITFSNLPLSNKMNWEYTGVVYYFLLAQFVGLEPFPSDCVVMGLFWYVFLLDLRTKCEGRFQCIKVESSLFFYRQGLTFIHL